MSVIDFISVRRTKDEQTSRPGPSYKDAPGSQGPLTASQFTRHVTHIVEDEMRRALKRHVDVIGPHEMIALAKMVAELKTRYLAMTLAIASNKTPMTDKELEEMRSLRQKIQELEAAYNEVTEAIMAQLVEVKGVTKE